MALSDRSQYVQKQAKVLSVQAEKEDGLVG
jgi:hypothetical protein